MKATHKFARISYKKLNVVAALIRRKDVDEALAFLKFAPKKAARLLYKGVSSAAANAEQSGEKRENLQIESVLVTKAGLWKRWKPASRGRAMPYRKHTSHFTVELTKKAGSKKDAKKVTPKKEVAPKDKVKEVVKTKKSEATPKKKAPARKTIKSTSRK